MFVEYLLFLKMVMIIIINKINIMLITASTTRSEVIKGTLLATDWEFEPIIIKKTFLSTEANTLLVNVI